VSDWRWNNRTPPILFLLQFSDGFAAPSGLPVKVDRTVYSLEVKLYCKDGLHFPPRAELQTLEQVMLSQDMERLKPMLTVLTAGSDIAGSSIASSKGRTEQVYRLPQGRSYILQSIWKNGREVSI
jgi:hypothetical protein